MHHSMSLYYLNNKHIFAKLHAHVDLIFMLLKSTSCGCYRVQHCRWVPLLDLQAEWCLLSCCCKWTGVCMSVYSNGAACIGLEMLAWLALEMLIEWLVLEMLLAAWLALEMLLAWLTLEMLLAAWLVLEPLLAWLALEMLLAYHFRLLCPTISLRSSLSTTTAATHGPSNCLLLFFTDRDASVGPIEK